MHTSGQGKARLSRINQLDGRQASGGQGKISRALTSLSVSLSRIVPSTSNFSSGFAFLMIISTVALPCKMQFG